MTNNKYKLILASNSPRRRELLAGIDVEFEICVIPDIDESFPDTLPREEVPETLARKKAEAYRNHLSDDNTLLITADTIVLLNNEILGKPADKADAQRMLRRLSGQTHTVITGVCLTSRNKQISFSDASKVTFGTLSDDEISYYVSKYQPMDKAGAYGVQEWIGYVAVERIEGSHYNVMGLPIHRLYKEMGRF